MRGPSRRRAPTVAVEELPIEVLMSEASPAVWNQCFKKEEKVTTKAHARMDTTGNPTDSRTASAVEPIAHSPLPWRIVGSRIVAIGAGVALVANPGCRLMSEIVEVQPDNERWDEAMANAEFIVKAVNCHAELIAALRGVLAIASANAEDLEGGLSDPVCDAARAVLVKAEGR